MSNRITNIIAVFLLISMFVLAVGSIVDDSATMDEVAHLPSGYSYLTQKDMRLNPEHPPLIKDLAAIPLLFIKDINFPSEIKDWKEDINGQWGFGFNFLYKAGNPADQMIFWGRIPMILILMLLGFYIFKWTRELYGNRTSLLALFLFSFSPTFLTHGRLVTTDVGAAAGIFIATYYFIKALKSPNKKNIILAGVSFGIAELFKFSAILLIPFFIFLTLIWWFFKSKKLIQTLRTLILTMVVGFLLIWPVYQYHVWNYPAEKQRSDTEFHLSSFGSRPMANMVIWMSDKPILRPYAQYSLGVLMVLQRASGGHTTYFMGELSNLGWKSYFPIVYLIKEPLTFHILTLITLLYAAWFIKRPIWINAFSRTKKAIRNHFSEFSMLAFISLYWITSLKSSLNIGVRHLLPIFPFVMLLASAGVVKLLKEPFLKIKYIVLGGLLLWQITSVVSIYPHFLSYFNEIAGGPSNGYIYTVDSNLDWGQDLKRLKNWTDENKIEKIYVDYFGGGDPQYYLQEKYESWWGNRNPEELPKGSYLAVSVSFLQGGRGKPIPGLNQPSGYYLWLDQYKPIKKIGYSIFVYYIE